MVPDPSKEKSGTGSDLFLFWSKKDGPEHSEAWASFNYLIRNPPTVFAISEWGINLILLFGISRSISDPLLGKTETHGRLILAENLHFSPSVTRKELENPMGKKRESEAIHLWSWACGWQKSYWGTWEVTDSRCLAQLPLCASRKCRSTLD